MRVLILSLSPGWKEPPRLVRALTEAGCETGSLAVSGSAIEYSDFLKQRYTLHADGDAQLADLDEAVDAFRPDRILPGDERSVWLLHAVYGKGNCDDRTRALIVESLGDPAWFGRNSDKLGMTRLSQSLGIPVPATIELVGDDDAHPFVHQHRFPVVIKRCCGFGGRDVYLCETLRELRRALRACDDSAPRLLQRFVDGVTWMVSFVALRGELLAALVAEKSRQQPPLTGPSTTVRFAWNPTLVDHARRLAGATGFSGFGSMDLLKPAQGDALFLEFNPRPTPICHLGRRVGVDLVGAYVDGHVRDSSGVNEGQRVALYPQEILRDPSGAGLAGCWHDIPEDEPRLLEALRS